MTRPPVRPFNHLRWRVGRRAEHADRLTAEETPVAIVHDGSTTAVMMATPADLEDFALGFSLSEGIINALDDVRGIEIVETELGIEARLWLTAPRSGALAARRRRLVGATGCGLCGIDSLAEAARPPPQIGTDDFKISASVLLSAMTALEQHQPLGAATRAVHAAALWLSDAPMLVREDVGRHNALDKLIGAAAKAEYRGKGVLLLTSRVSIEMVQKAAVLGAPILCAVSAPTTAAIEMADACVLTLVGVARADGFEVFTRPDRIDLDG